MEQIRQRRQPTREASRYADVLVELTQLTFDELLPTIALGAVGLVGTFVLLAIRFRDSWLWAFASLILIGAVTRSTIVLLFQDRPQQGLTLRSAYRWQFTYFLSTVTYALLVGLATVYNFYSHDATSWILSVIAVFMLCAGLIGQIGLYPWMVCVSAWTPLACVAVGVLLLPDPLARWGVILIALYSCNFYFNAKKRFNFLIEQVRSRRSLRLLADTDPLTGLANRRIFEDRLSSLCLAEAPFAILFLDLDQFKSINDTHGHVIGDILLQRTAARLRASIRKGDLVARIGGDEFAILKTSGVTQQTAESLARRVNRAIAAPFEIEGRHISVGTSIGIRFSTLDDVDPSDMLTKADQALYLAKQAGGGRFATFQPELPPA